VGAALLLAVQAVRNAAVAQFAELLPARAAQFWPGHPRADLTIGLTEIAVASREHKRAGRDTFARITEVALKMPLAPEPFLVRGVQAQLAGDPALAGQAFRAAELRDGRAISARYFLAEYYFRTGDARSGLREIAALSRLVPNGAGSLAPYVAAYSKDPRNWPALKALFQSDPALEDATLSALSADPRNADLVLKLADVRNRPPAGLWPNRLIANLVAAKQYGSAREIWAQIAGVRPDNGIFDAQFRESKAPPPFNWVLTSSAVGLAERRNGLHVIFYGQEDGPLASQLLLLGPGAYRLTMPVAGDIGHAGSLVWTLTCANSNAPISRFALDAGAAARGWDFSVPAGCPAQMLTLSGVSSDMPQQMDVTIAQLQLERQRG
jgi:hypothetical protein